MEPIEKSMRNAFELFVFGRVAQKQPPEVFYKKGVLKNFAKSTGKHLPQSFFFNKVADLRPATLFKKRLWQKYFPMNFSKPLRTPILKNICERLLLFAGWRTT